MLSEIAFDKIISEISSATKEVQEKTSHPHVDKINLTFSSSAVK